jgi:hypothetical protein
LVHDAYVKAGLALANPCGLRVTPYQLLPTTEILIAAQGGRVICTMSLVRDGRLGLPLEELYAEQVAARRQRGLRLAEVSCFADYQPERKAWFSRTIAVMRLAAQCSIARGLDEVLIAVHPKHTAFYERFLGFEVVGEERTYATVLGHPAVLMSLDLHGLGDRHPRSYARLFGSLLPTSSCAECPMPDYLREQLAITLSLTAPSNEPVDDDGCRVLAR